MLKKDVVKAESLGSIPRILDTLNCFYQLYNSWPTQLLLDKSWVDDIQEYCLTPERWRSLENKLVINRAKGTVIAMDDKGQCYEYDAEHIQPKDQNSSADYWLWGCSVWPEVLDEIR